MVDTFTKITITVPDSAGDDVINEVFWRCCEMTGVMADLHPDLMITTSSISGVVLDD